MKNFMATFVFAVAAFACTLDAMAVEDATLMGVRKYCEEFTVETSNLMTQAFQQYESAVKQYTPQAGSPDAFYANIVSRNLWSFGAYVDLAQDVLLASRVEAGISVSTKASMVLYEDTLGRFPGPLNGMVSTMNNAINEIKSSQLRGELLKVATSLAGVAKLFAEWPGKDLRQTLISGDKSTPGMPQQLVDIAIDLDKMNDTLLESYKNGPTLQVRADKFGPDYVDTYLQTSRTTDTLQILAMSIYMLNVAKHRAKSTESVNGYSKGDEAIVSYYLTGRTDKYKALLGHLGKQCELMKADDAGFCEAASSTFAKYLKLY